MLFDFLSQLFGGKKGSEMAFSGDPVVEARRAIFKRKLPEDLTNYNICLAEYDSQATLDFAKPELGWKITFYRDYIKEYARQVRKRGGTTQICMVRLQDYLNWLKASGLRHCAEVLEQYVEFLSKNK